MSLANTGIREPVVRGMFYPAGKDTLQKMISSFLIAADPPVREKKEILGLIAPHAGYVYSGACAGYAYKILKNRKADTVILLGPSHHTMLEGSALWLSGAFRTPLGDVILDEEAGRFLLDQDRVVEDYRIAHLEEHSLEVQLPFLQFVWRNTFRLVPVVIGNPGFEYISRLAEALYKLISRNDRKYLVIASSDLSHYHTDEAAKRMDRLVVDLIRRNIPDELNRLVETGKGEACGIGPILALLALSKKFPSPLVDILNVTNSGETSGDKSRVVGYMSAAVYI